MKALIQRVSSASVSVGEQRVSEIGGGFLLLLGLTHTDSEVEVQVLSQKISKLRVFNDDEGKMNLSIQDVGGSILLVSQFTLYGNATKGNRPSFVAAMHPDQAQALYERFAEALRALKIPVQCGVFGAEMDVALHNDGPVTLMLECVDGKIL
ncbi:MAG: D-aminoacyl-tRNA deacylase [Bradymonadales bacterium]|jgi:D-tyrosyl-tRNA(Tyr) deacylase